MSTDLPDPPPRYEHAHGFNVFLLTLLLAGTGVYSWDDPVISLLWTKEGSRRKKVNLSNGLQSMVNKILYSTVL